ncbi:LytR/AlgR family response regulator transcription factor [Pedobacter agri]|uniref:LytR/AlgR family response regulator transcription factor n=1 Tax=Pedobacter agri TaxID=454586 RepID=UPI00292CCD9A|nr:response regulator [Pedobacter agri]
MDYANNSPYKCIIVDDDQLSIDILANFLSKIPDFEVVKTYIDPAKAIMDLRSESDIDFLFLDIRMDISGLDVAKVLRDSVRFLFFVTSYEEYAIDAFGVNGDKFLVKPIIFKKLVTAIDEVLQKEKKQKGYSIT